ncbi:hypothetical protein cypCar_00031641 [Cyprinus carpio]|nr:hypothetical protein cypCar_00031641 [Cyprinus carpio]
MTSENHGTVTADSAVVMSPTGPRSEGLPSHLHQQTIKSCQVEIPVTPTTPTVPISPSTPGVKPWVTTTDDKQGQTSVPAPAPYRPSV